MKTVILAAGKGTRMGKMTTDTPKPLLKIGPKNLLEIKIEALPDQCDEVVMVVGYLGHKIRQHFGSKYADKKITYIESDTLGTGYSLWQAKDILNERFIVMNGDDLYDPTDILQCLRYRQSALVLKKDTEGSGGNVKLDSDGFIVDITEGTHPPGHIVATGLYVLEPEIFQYELIKIPGREEFGLPQTLVAHGLAKKIKAVFATSWKQVTSPSDLQ